jgi:predicted PurR-regulated permease PerM
LKKNWTTQTRIFVISILMILFALFLVFIRDLINPLIISALVAFLLYPLVTGLRNRTPLSQKAAGNFVFVISLVVIAIIPATVTPVLIGELDALGEQLTEIIDGINEFSQMTVMGYQIFSSVPADIEQSITGLLNAEMIYGSIATVTQNLVWVTIILIILYYLLVDWPRARKAIFLLVPESLKSDFYELFVRIRKIWNTYLRGQLTIMLVMGILSGISAAILGFPSALILGLVAAALALVPSVGSTVFIGVAVLVALFSQKVGFGLPKIWFVLIVAAVYFGISLFENYWLRPRVLGPGLKLHPGIILVGVLGGAALGGALLALVVVPLISTAGVVLNYILKKLADEDPWAEVTAFEPGEHPVEADLRPDHEAG